jgi:hypothetical protein
VECGVWSVECGVWSVEWRMACRATLHPWRPVSQLVPPATCHFGPQCSAVQCSAVQCSAVQCSAVQCSSTCPSCCNEPGVGPRQPAPGLHIPREGFRVRREDSGQLRAGAGHDPDGVSAGSPRAPGPGRGLRHPPLHQGPGSLPPRVSPVISLLPIICSPGGLTGRRQLEGQFP